jgi:hypothetical protein
MAYASIGQAGQLLAQEASRLLPGHPKLRSQQSLAQVKGITPKDSTRVPAATSGSISLGPGRPRMVMFFATWLGETSPLADRLAGLNDYARAARRDKLPPLVALDEAVSEPSSATARSYLAQLARQGKRLSYPVGLDATGRIADGYGVQDLPWFALVSASGKIIWRHDGWVSASALAAAARRA